MFQRIVGLAKRGPWHNIHSILKSWVFVNVHGRILNVKTCLKQMEILVVYSLFNSNGSRRRRKTCKFQTNIFKSKTKNIYKQYLNCFTFLKQFRFLCINIYFILLNIVPPIRRGAEIQTVLWPENYGGANNATLTFVVEGKLNLTTECYIYKIQQLFSQLNGH